ncbi:hypothetical protein TWF730_000453 [Orbilia blumenaviensis]|uniref:glucan endo-1,3-beta-D-glucosidase n=1 Tax=Orbilia blumenaviensis TaxID=1796055 RepID=A0AAV9VLM2_9PEZI
MVAARLAVWAVAAAGIISGVIATPLGRDVKLDARAITTVKVHNPTVKVFVVLDQYGNTVSRGSSIVDSAATPAPSPTKGRKKNLVTKTLDEADGTASPTPSKSSGGKSGKHSKPAKKPANDGKLGKGIVYSVYHDSGKCKDRETTRSEIKKVLDSGNGYNWLRIYGTDCDQVANVMGAAYDGGVKVMLGIYNLNDDAGFQKELDAIIAGVKAANKEYKREENDWSGVAFVSVGNEVVNNNAGEAEAWVAKSLKYAALARSALKEAGYTGDVGNAEVWFWYKKFPALCGEDKLVMLNLHPFFDQNCDVASSGTFMKEKLAEIQEACGSNHKVIIAETGWPNSGNKLNKAVPGKAEQAQFLKLAAENLDDYVLLSAYDEGWKTENSSAEVEKHWGILGTSPSN